jgi:MFS family permease
MVRALGVDLRPLASRPYRRLYVAGLVTSLGQQASYATIPFQLRQITHSALAVGAVGLVEVVPLVLGGLYGGYLADVRNRRRVIVLFEVALALATGLLVLNGRLTHPSALVIYGCAFALAAAGALQRPSIEALNQSLVGHELQRASATLANLRYTGASIVGPTLGGLVAVALGPSWVYGANLVTYVVSLALLWSLPSTPGTESAARPRELVAAGLGYLRTRPDIVGTYVVDLLAMAWAFPVGMLSFVAARFSEHYALSLLYLGLPVGALVATLTSRWAHRIHRYGRAIVASAMLWGVGVTVFALGGSLVLALVGLAIAGGADAMSGVFRSTLWNESIPPDLRGRMAGVEMISYSIGPTAGQFRAGATTAWMSLRASLALGGIGAALSVGSVALALPSLWRFDARVDPHVAEVRRLRTRPPE